MAKGFEKLASAVTDLFKAAGGAAKEGPKLGMGTAKLGGNLAMGTASAGAGLAGGIIGTVAKFVQKHPKLTFLAGLYGAIKGIQHFTGKRREAAEARDFNQQHFQPPQPYGQQPAFGAPSYAAPQQFDAPFVPQPPQAPQQPQMSQDDLVRQVLEAVEAAQAKQNAQAAPQQAAAAPQPQEAGSWRQSVETSRQNPSQQRSV